MTSPARHRAEQLRQRLINQGMIGQEDPLIFVAVCCNLCGEIVRADTPWDLEHAFQGWSLSPFLGGNDYCPNCQP